MREISEDTLMPMKLIIILLSAAFGMGYTFNRLDSYSELIKDQSDRIASLEYKVDKLTNIIVDGKMKVSSNGNP